MDSFKNIHSSISYSPMKIPIALKNCGPNLSLETTDEDSILRRAIQHNNFDIVCEQLYNGADVNTLCKRNLSPFTYALHLSRLKIAEVLFPYHYNNSLTNIYGYTVLHLAAWRKSPISIELVKAGVDVNCVTNYGDTPLVFSLQHTNADLFKLIWPKCNRQLLLHSEKPFLLTYIEICQFSVMEWLEYINLILDSQAAFDLIKHCRHYLEEDIYHNGFFWELLHTFHKMHIKQSDRIIIIYKCLSLGAKVNILDISLAIDLFGYTKEFETLIYHIEWSMGIFLLSCYDIFPLPMCVYGLEGLGSDELNKIVVEQISINCDSFNSDYIQRVIVNTLGYFALSFQQKQEIATACKLHLHQFDQIYEKLDAIPEMPSLLELARNKTLKTIQSFNVTKAYQFFDVVKMLHLPEVVKDVLRFRKPVY